MEFADSGETQFQRIAFGMDIRNGEALQQLSGIIQNLRARGNCVQILFMDASDEVLVKRYKETRRAHPLAGTDRVEKGIELERKQVKFLKEMADYIIDTSQLLTRELNAAIGDIFLGHQEYDNIYLTILSFGFKYGIPADADLVFDVRFLPNPFYVEELRNMTGNDRPVADFICRYPQTFQYLKLEEQLLDFLVPQYINEGKAQLVISVGCTGGQHRSVFIANKLYEYLREKGYSVDVTHRDIPHRK